MTDQSARTGRITGEKKDGSCDDDDDDGGKLVVDRREAWLRDRSWSEYASCFVPNLDLSVPNLDLSTCFESLS